MGISKIKKIRLSTYDKRWSKMAREAQPSCEYCGKTENLAAHHYIGRANKATRLLLNNSIILCPSCHTFSSVFSAHKTPEKFKRWFKKYDPEREKMLTKTATNHCTERQAIETFKMLWMQK